MTIHDKEDELLNQKDSFYETAHDYQDQYELKTSKSECSSDDDDASHGNENDSAKPILFDKWSFRYEASCLKSSMDKKASPMIFKNWIDLSLTLDGRDKITKVIQYASRLLGSYYESSASSVFVNENQYGLFMEKARRFRNLQKALTSSRKAYRLGRTVIEFEKLRSMGILHWIVWYIREALPIDSSNNRRKCLESPTKGPNGPVSCEERMGNQQASEERPVVNLPRSISSNIGFSLNYSTLGKMLYRTLTSYIDQDIVSKEALPLWKVLLTACKLIGLGGFWLGDNISYLYSVGFLENSSSREKSQHSSTLFATRSYFFASVSGLLLNLRELFAHRNGPLKKAIMNLEEHKLRIKNPSVDDKDESTALKMHYQEEELQRLENLLMKVKQTHSTICIALMKSCCDVIVFSNNPGVDLHLKLRGRKMHEGVQSMFGIVSALTVLYNNFPNRKN
jgi:hypothetical protein